MKKIIAICIVATATSITLYCRADVKEDSARKSNTVSEPMEFDWSKLRSEPSKWYDQDIALEGWIHVYVDAMGKVSAVWLRENLDSLQYSFNRRSVEVSRTGFLKSVSRGGIDADAMAVTLSGKPFRISGKLMDVGVPQELGEITGEIKVEAITERRTELSAEFYHKK